MAERAESKELAVIGPAGVPAALPMPAAAVIVLRQTPNAAFAAEEFFKAALSNEHTRRAYGRIAGRFLTWCDRRGIEHSPDGEELIISRASKPKLQLRVACNGSTTATESGERQDMRGDFDDVA